jgi:hypothetical protein
MGTPSESEMSLMVTTVPAATPAAGAVQLKLPSPLLKALPVHSRSEKKIVVPPGMAASATNARLSLPSALKPVKAIEPGARAMS